MDGCSSKRGVATIRAPRDIGSTDAKSNRDQIVHFCNRRGCNGRIKYANQNMKPESSNKAKSSMSGSIMTREKSSSHLDSKTKLSSQLRFDQSESSQSGDSEAMSSGSTNIAEQVPKNGSVASSVRSGSSKQKTQTASAVSPTRKSSGLRTLAISNRSSSQKMLKCNSASYASPPSCSSSRSKPPTKDVMKKGESSLCSRGRQTTAAATTSGCLSSSSGGASTSASRHSSCTSGLHTSVSPSARTGGSSNVNKSRMKLPLRQNGRSTSCIRESEPPRTVGRPRLRHQSANPTSSGLSSRLVNGDFLALEEYEELTHEEILALETSFFLYDQHRDMRLDIDNMSYEELLALEDMIGTVSTAVSEEELRKCVKRSVFEEVVVCKEAEDVKCSICQEEYVEGDEMGEMVGCHHAYHVECVNQWLRMKNWCPICKTTAAPS